MKNIFVVVAILGISILGCGSNHSDTSGESSDIQDYTFSISKEVLHSTMVQNGVIYAVSRVPSMGSGAISLSKFVNGSEVWSDTIDNVPYDGHVVSDIDGNAYLLGTNNSYDIFLIKYSTNGEKLWVKEIGSASFDYGVDVKLSDAGFIYVAGTTTGTIGEAAYGGYDGFLAKFTLNGEIVWIKQTGSADYDDIKSLAIDNVGNIYTCGFSSDGSSYRAVVTKFDSEGNSTAYELGSGYEVALAMDVFSDNSISVAGIGFGGFDEMDSGFLVRADAQVAISWTNLFGGGNWIWPLDLKVDQSANSYLLSNYKDGALLLLQKYDQAGNLLWEKILWDVRADEITSGRLFIDDSGETITVFRLSSIDMAGVRLDKNGSFLNPLY